MIEMMGADKSGTKGKEKEKLRNLGHGRQ